MHSLYSTLLVSAAPSCTVSVRYAIDHSIDSTAIMVERRARVCSVIGCLARALDEDHNCIIGRCDTAPVAQVLLAFLEPKHIALTRELRLVARLQDAAAPVGLILGLPMLGQAAPVRGLLRRYHPPLASIYCPMGNGRVARNTAVLECIHSSSDADLDMAAFEKSLADKGTRRLSWPV